jgi:hypothetical protein
MVRQFKMHLNEDGRVRLCWARSWGDTWSYSVVECKEYQSVDTGNCQSNTHLNH